MSLKLSGNSSLSLDFIRFLAAEMVVVGHGLWDFGFYKSFAMHDLAVLIFFILSGFLISLSLAFKMKDKLYTFKEYFIDRFSRIYSALIPCLFIIALLDVSYYSIFEGGYKYSDSLNAKSFFGNVLMLQDHPVLLHLKYFLMASTDSLLYIDSFGSGRPLWSLAVEWWMYLLFGWLFLKGSRITNRNYYLILLILSIVPVYNIFSGYKTNGLAIVWIMGCMVTAMLDYNGKVKNINNGLLSFLFAILALLSIYNSRNGYDILTAILLTLSLYFLIVHSNKSNWEAPVMLNKLFKFGAGYSFTLYLLHYSMLEYALVYPKTLSPELRFFFYFLISNLVSLVVAQFTEMRHKKLSAYLKKKYLLS